jgi:hypothetical protein
MQLFFDLLASAACPFLSTIYLLLRIYAARGCRPTTLFYLCHAIAAEIIYIFVTKSGQRTKVQLHGNLKTTIHHPKLEAVLV